MNRQHTSSAVREWIAHDPDPQSAAELAACSEEELGRRFSRPLTFGTAGLRGPLRAGPNGMNLAVVLRATWAVAKVLTDRGLGGSAVIVGRDARHGSEEFARAAAEVLAAQDFAVSLLPEPAPTPVLAFTVRRDRAAAGIQITASHNPPSDNGYKVYFENGFPIVPPADREIEAAIESAPHADEIRRRPIDVVSAEVVQRYLVRASQLRHTHEPVRVALTPLHGVGGALAVEALALAGVPDTRVVASQFAPDPDFPTLQSPNPENPEAVRALLELAAEVDAEIAIALDPDADRCAIGFPTPTGWRMLSGDETGWLLGDYILSRRHGDPGTAVVASTVVSSRMLSSIARAHGARHVETLTGFKWLVRADADSGGDRLVYAYEEAIGHCVDPEAVRDKDGISAAVMACDLVAALRRRGSQPQDALDDLALRHGVHATTAVTRSVADPDESARVMTRLRETAPKQIAGYEIAKTDLLTERRPLHADAVILSGGDADSSVRIVVRPSGTEPKVKSYIEVRLDCSDKAELARTRDRAAALQNKLVDIARQW